MMTVQCPSCNKMYNVPETMGGKQVRCKSCQTVFVIGAQQQAPQAPEVQMQPAAQPGQVAPAQAPMAQEAPGAMAPVRAAAGGGKPIVIIAGAVVALAALAAVAYFVVIPMIFGGQPSWTKSLMPEGTKLVAYIDIESIRESDLFDKMKGMVREQGGGDIDQVFQKGLAQSGMKSNLKLDDIEGIFVAGSGFAGPTPKMIIGLRLTRAMSLSDVISGAGVAKKKHKDYEYVIASVMGDKLYLARIDDETFCAAPSEDLLKKALDRVESGDSVELDDDLSSILSTVSRKDTFVAGTLDAIPQLSFTPPGLKSFGLGLEINGSFGGVLVIDFKDAAEAEKLAEQAEEGLEKAREQAAKSIEQMKEAVDKASGAQKEQMEKMLEMTKTMAGWLDDVDVDQSGSTVEFTASIDTDELVEMFDRIKDMLGGLMGGMMGGPRRR